MNQQVFQTNEEWLLEQGALRTRRQDLRMVLEDRFQPLPPDLLQRIEAEKNLERLEKCLKQALRIHSLEELSL